METLKNFLIGLFVIALSLIIIGLVALSWPLLVGISSLILSILAAILFLFLIFYIIVLIGHVTRLMIKKK